MARATVTIKYTPRRVIVSDDRNSVAGANVTVTHGQGTPQHGVVIPPEGDGLDCWISHWLACWVAGAPEDGCPLVEALETAARASEAGAIVFERGEDGDWAQSFDDEHKTEAALRG